MFTHYKIITFIIYYLISLLHQCITVKSCKFFCEEQNTWYCYLKIIDQILTNSFKIFNFATFLELIIFKLEEKINYMIGQQNNFLKNRLYY